jgi:DNA polymerase I-like protein with 3'-5' exonuclease and polymerase domains
MIRVVTNQETGYSGNWDEFVRWVTPQTELQFDIETNVTQWWCTKQVKTLQFGDVEGQVQYVLEYSILDDAQLSLIKEVLESWQILKLIHRASFEYVVMAFHGIEVHNVYCTLVAEKVLQGGAENVDYALADLTRKYLKYDLDKGLQTSFGDGILTPEKVKYAADDVVPLGKIKALQDAQTKKWGLENVMWLEMRSLLAFSECTYHGVALDLTKWRENIALAQPIVTEAKKQLDQWIRDDSRLLAKAVDHNFYKVNDTVNFNLNSPVQKLQLLKLVFPDIQGASLSILKAYMRDNNSLPANKMYLLVTLLEKDTQPFSEYLVKNHREELIESNLLLPAGTIQINWNSIDQALLVLQGVEPKLKSLSEDSLGKVTHPVFEQLSDYKDSLKLTSSYGEAFIEKHVEPDGRVRTNYNQVVSTGRSSSAKPNMQNIPAKESPKSVVDPWLKDNPGKKPKDFFYRYRNSFTYDPDWVFVDSDFTGQELCLIAFASQDDVWYKAIERGEDLHSVTAAMVFGRKWTAATQGDCVFATDRQKCKCAGHQTLRTAVKTINFGLAYGMSKYKLASTIRCSVQEAQQLIDQYFETFPQIKKTLTSFGRFALENGYTQSLKPFFRKRWFANWESLRSRVQLHTSNIDYNASLGRIERQAKNHPIQGSGGDSIKMAMWLTYKYIRDNKLTDKIHIVLNVHDQLTTVCEKSIADDWCVTFDKLMCDAAKIIIPTGLLKAETMKSPVWTK